MEYSVEAEESPRTRQNRDDNLQMLNPSKGWSRGRRFVHASSTSRNVIILTVIIDLYSSIHLFNAIALEDVKKTLVEDIGQSLSSQLYQGIIFSPTIITHTI